MNNNYNRYKRERAKKAMAIIIKNDDEINLMRTAGKIVEKVHDAIEKHIKPGITTLELDQIAVDTFNSLGAIASFKDYRGFPNSICASVNDEVIHGIPNKRKLKDGDIISIDVGAYIGGFHGDAARTHAVGTIAPDLQKLIDVTRESFFIGAALAKSGNRLFEISAAVQDYVESNGFSVVREYVGHGIGRSLHEEPSVPHYRMKSKGPRLYRGMTFCVEPMVNMGTHEIDLLEDDWTVVTVDGQYSAHYENTILITDGEPEFLTLS